MKKLADVTLKNECEVVFSEEGKKIKSWNIAFMQEIFQDMIIHKERKGKIMYVSEKEYEDYMNYKNEVGDSR